jgi:crotonobetainyl-CoA:carnitine CoA-transferase CaiB-like acyl-CoA transferase
LEHDRNGRSTSVAGSLLGAGVLTTSETFLRPDGTLAPVPTLDKDQMVMTSGCRLLRCLDGWVAMAAHREADVSAACRALSSRDADDLPRAVSERTVTDVVKLLSDADVPAEEVRLDQRDSFFDSVDNDAAGLIARYKHQEWGQLEQPGSLWYFGDLETRFTHAPPLLGQHTVEVLTEVGLERSEVESLLASGAARQS